jgi:hypothetical protein
MLTNHCLAKYVRAALLAAALLVPLVIDSTAWAQVCNPACAAGQLCVQGTCMVPAPPPAAYPPPPASAYPPPPAATYQPPPANAYPPPPANTYQPPPGYAYPPPNAYAPPPGYYAPPPTAPYPGNYAPPPPPDRRHRGFLALPVLGINSYRGDTGSDLGAGFRFGTLLGGRVNEMFSINGELTVDVLNPDNVPSGVDVTMLDIVFAASPLYHFIAGNVEFVAGPKIGGHALSQQVTNAAFGEPTNQTWNGYVLGLNSGVFAAVSRGMSIGGLLSFEFRTVHQYCSTQSGFAQQCTTNNTGPSFKVLGVMGALLF